MSLSNNFVLIITLEAWNEVISVNNNNIVARFKSGDIWPTSFPEMQSLWQLYNDGGVNSKLIYIQPWITCQ